MMIKYILAISLISLLPGPSMMLVVMNTLKQGVKAGLGTIMGVILADALLLTLTFLGIGLSLSATSFLYEPLKWGGAMYLIYLGYSELRAKASKQRSMPSDDKNLTFQAIGVTLLNPKILLFLVAFFPPFIDTQKSLVSQYMILAPVFLIMVGVILCIYLLFAHSVRKVFYAQMGQRILSWISGLLLIGLGVGAAAS